MMNFLFGGKLGGPGRDIKKDDMCRLFAETLSIGIMNPGLVSEGTSASVPDEEVNYDDMPELVSDNEDGPVGSKNQDDCAKSAKVNPCQTPQARRAERKAEKKAEKKTKKSSKQNDGACNEVSRHKVC